MGSAWVYEYPEIENVKVIQNRRIKYEGRRPYVAACIATERSIKDDPKFQPRRQKNRRAWKPTFGYRNELPTPTIAWEQKYN